MPGRRLDEPADHLPRARAVELAQVDPLPLPQHELAALYEHMLAAPDQDRLEMAVTVALGVLIKRFPVGDELLKLRQEVMLHVRVGVLLDRHARRGVRDENQDIPILDA